MCTSSKGTAVKIGLKIPGGYGHNDEIPWGQIFETYCRVAVDPGTKCVIITNKSFKV